MNCAIVENGIVENLIVIHENNAKEFSDAIAIENIPVKIGDTYTDGRFFREGEVLLSPLEQANETIAVLDTAVVDLTYENILLELGV